MLEILRKRRSIRKFKDQSPDDEIIHALAEALLRSPSSRNIKPWEFFIVRDRALVGKLSKAKPHGSAFLEGAPLAIVVCGDPSKSDVWVEDCSIASIIAQLEAQALNLGSCWIQIRKRMHDSTKSAGEYVREILEIPPGLEVESIIALGLPAEEKNPVPELDYEKIHIINTPPAA